MIEDLSYAEVTLRITIAVVAGSLLGFERRDKPAGFRTHALVSLGAALFMLASVLMGQAAAESGNQAYDPSRIASTIVQGVGFIAAGVIFSAGSRVTGLTTAASLWVTAAIGLLIGAGFYEVAIIGTVAAFIVLELFERAERMIFGFKGEKAKASSDLPVEDGASPHDIPHRT